MRLEEIGNKIKSLRKEKNLTQEQLAQKSGISRVTLGKLERGEFGSVSVNTLNLVLNNLNYTLNVKQLSGFGLSVLGDN